ncbi:23S rRNA (adenine(2030)-N(6))-methyltransferase RlmJ [Duganella sp. FT92W]|uniref:Ribosomal RNA large subunit methyltransferase J n=1 Tax=Pseudoduganella rivuli TaxID=2666085 RepID=A0A7X2LTJ7_9BURK|nr:23S rRNA (adenine(2030)-N(6))-methyltransferase RlmJ [Pseudoduganella rivuli]MRV71924.1 23S rRNA (adenine(2030)-N(6))-methyltransferase RlmJ [Pseudoduganella rivuli]
MFSYRHAFHAGNHADVLKHFVLIQLLQYMNRKDTAYTYIDTHAGAGVYQLDGEYAAKSGESATGIAPLWERDDLPEALAEYVDLIKKMNPSGKLRFYPGSPYCAEQVAREQDRLRMYEMHPADFKLLTDNFRKLAEHAAAQGQRPSVRGQRALVTRADGFQSLKALLPPPSRRAVVLCDPPYEDKQDYRKVSDMLHEALKRFPGGMYAVWYPILQRIEARNFAERLKHMPGTEWLNVSLTIRTPGPDGFGGLHSSGMFIINPPYTLEATLKQVMPYLVDVLGVDAGASFVLESGLAATTPRLTASPHADGPRAAASPRSSGQRAGSGRPQGDAGSVYGGGKARGASGRPGSDRARSERPGGDRAASAGAGADGANRGRPGSERMRDARPPVERAGGNESRAPRGDARPSGMGGSGAADGAGRRGGRPAGKPFAGTGRTSGPRNGPRKG